METMKEILLEDFQYNVVLVIANNCHQFGHWAIERLKFQHG
jgi:hypothetical protein